MKVQVSIKNSSHCERVLSVAVPKELIHEEYTHFFNRISKDARVPGFRPGKVPREVLESHYHGEAREKVLENLIARSFREAIQEKQIEFLGRPTIQQINFTDDKLSYEALIEIPPAIKLRKYKGLAATKPPLEVKPEEVEQALEEVRNSVAKFVAVEDRPSQWGDFLIADYQCLIEGKQVENRTDDWFELREGEFLKGFSNQLVGVKAGEEREVHIQFPEKFGRKDWAGKEGVFKVGVKEIKAKKLPALDDEFAKETGEFETLTDLRVHLQKQIESRKNQQAEIQLENALLEALVKENPFEVPKGVVERRRATLVHSAMESLAQQGMQQELIQGEIKKFEEKMQPEAERQVRLSFLLDEIAKKEDMKLSDSDYEAKYKEIAARHRQSEEAVRKYYTEHAEAKEGLGIQILNEKVIQFIKANAGIK